MDYKYEWSPTEQVVLDLLREARRAYTACEKADNDRTDYDRTRFLQAIVLAENAMELRYNRLKTLGRRNENVG